MQCCLRQSGLSSVFRSGCMRHECWIVFEFHAVLSFRHKGKIVWRIDGEGARLWTVEEGRKRGLESWLRSSRPASWRSTTKWEACACYSLRDRRRSPLGWRDNEGD